MTRTHARYAVERTAQPLAPVACLGCGCDLLSVVCCAVQEEVRRAKAAVNLAFAEEQQKLVEERRSIKVRRLLGVGTRYL